MTSKGKKGRRGAPSGEAPTIPGQGTNRRRITLYITCEGHTERDYFKHIEDTYGDEVGFTITLSPGKQPEGGLKPVDAVGWALSASTDLHPADRKNVWVVFDRDQHVRIPESIRHARDNDINIAFSHPSFDLWLWLHFAPGVPPRLTGDNHWVVAKLRTVPSFRDYAKNNGHKTKRLTAPRAADLHGEHDGSGRKKAEQAVWLARALVRSCSSGRCDPNGKAPGAPGHADDCDVLMRDTSTDVYRILEVLGIVRTN